MLFHLDWSVAIPLSLGMLALYFYLSAPVSSAERAEKREQRASRKAALAVSKAERQAWRHRVFGSHPVLYWGLAWLSAPAVLCLSVAAISALMGH